MIEKKNTVAFRLAQTAYELQKLKGEDISEKFLIDSMEKLKFVRWEQVATIDTYQKLLKNLIKIEE